MKNIFKLVCKGIDIHFVRLSNKVFIKLHKCMKLVLIMTRILSPIYLIRLCKLAFNSSSLCSDFSASEVLENHKSVLTSFGIQTNNEELDLPYIYWIPKMHKNPYKRRIIAGSSKWSTKPLSILLTKLLTHIKQGLQKYCKTAYSRSWINQMWILKNSKELLVPLWDLHVFKCRDQSLLNLSCLRTFEFRTPLGTSLLH